MMRASMLWGAALSAALLTAPVLAKSPGWLLRVSEAAKLSTYEGTLVYDDGESLEALHVVHRYANGEELQRMVSLTGEPREVLRQNDQNTYVYPRRRQVVHELQQVKTLLGGRKVAALDQHYRLVALGNGRVAGRAARGYLLEPRDEYRYGLLVWLDQERNFPLKVALLDASGRSLERVMFTDIAFPASVSDTALRSAERTEGFERIGEAVSRKLAASTRWLLPELPPGFKVQLRDLRRLPDTDVLAEHLLISDGLSSVSLYSVPLGNAEVPMYQGMSHMGALHAYRRAVGQYHVTVMGEAPVQTVRLIGDSLELEDLAAKQAP